VKRVVLPKSAGAVPESEKVTSKSVGSGGGSQVFRAGIEGSISVLSGAALGWGSVFGSRGRRDGAVGGLWGIVAHNLRQIARRQVERQAA
jgi:hypothetical protein